MDTITQQAAHPARHKNARPVTDEPGRRALMRNNPAVHKANWLPDGLWPELDEAAAEHKEAVRALEAAGAESRALGQKFKDEDDARMAAYETGLEVPAMTDPAERNAQVSEAAAKFEGAQRRVARAAAAAVETVQKNEASWMEDLLRQRTEADEKVEEAKRLLAEAQQTLGETEQTAVWVRRTADNLLGRHISMDSLGAVKPKPPVDLATLVGTEL